MSGVSKTHRARIPSHVHTDTLADVPIHLDCHTHTPPRDGTSSVSRLNYSSPFVPVRLPFPSPPSLSPLSERQAATKTRARHVGRCSPPNSNTTPASEEVWGGHAYQMCPPNVLIWLNVPSETTTLGGKIFCRGAVSQSALWMLTIRVLCPAGSRQGSSAGSTNNKAPLLTVGPEHTWLSAKRISPNINNNRLSMPNIMKVLNSVILNATNLRFSKK